MELRLFKEKSGLGNQKQCLAWSGNSKLRRALQTEQSRGMEKLKDYVSQGTEALGIRK